MSNICHKCRNHEFCIEFRYNNIKLKRMEEITIEKNKDGKEIIFVQKCSKFSKRNPFRRKNFKKRY